jgi:hypothetical protein
MLSHRLGRAVFRRNEYSGKFCVAAEIFLILTISFVRALQSARSLVRCASPVG